MWCNCCNYLIFNSIHSPTSTPHSLTLFHHDSTAGVHEKCENVKKTKKKPKMLCEYNFFFSFTFFSFFSPSQQQRAKNSFLYCCLSFRSTHKRESEESPLNILSTLHALRHLMYVAACYVANKKKKRKRKSTETEQEEEKRWRVGRHESKLKTKKNILKSRIRWKVDSNE